MLVLDTCDLLQIMAGPWGPTSAARCTAAAAGIALETHLCITSAQVGGDADGAQSMLEEGHLQVQHEGTVRLPSPGDASFSSGADSDLSSFMIESVYSAPDLLGGLHSNHASSAALSAAAASRPSANTRSSGGSNSTADSSVVSGITDATGYSVRNPLRQASSATAGSSMGRGRQSSSARYRSRPASTAHSYSNIGGFLIMRPSLSAMDAGLGAAVAAGILPGGDCVVTGLTEEDYDGFGDEGGSLESGPPARGSAYAPPSHLGGQSGRPSAMSRLSAATTGMGGGTAGAGALSPGPENRNL